MTWKGGEEEVLYNYVEDGKKGRGGGRRKKKGKAGGKMTSLYIV